MFNFFNEIIADYGLELSSFNLVNMSNKLVYVEGHKGVISIKEEVISFKVKKGAISIYGKNLIIKRITDNCLVVTGEINNIESF